MARISARPIAILLLTLSPLGCRHAQTVGADADPPGKNPAAVLFRDVSDQAGLRFAHHSGLQGKKFMPETVGSGCAFIDYNDDGFYDLFFVNGTDWPGPHAQSHYPALYRNVCDETGRVRKHVNLFVNMDNIRDVGGLDAALAAGDVLTILPSVSGG